MSSDLTHLPSCTPDRTRQISLLISKRASTNDRNQPTSRGHRLPVANEEPQIRRAAASRHAQFQTFLSCDPVPEAPKVDSVDIPRASIASEMNSRYCILLDLPAFPPPLRSALYVLICSCFHAFQRRSILMQMPAAHATISSAPIFVPVFVLCSISIFTRCYSRPPTPPSPRPRLARSTCPPCAQ